MKLSLKKRLLLATLSGILLAISFPAVGGVGPLALLALVPLLLLEEDLFQNKDRSYKIYFYSFLTFFLYNLITVWWIWFASEGGAIMAVVANSIVMVLPIAAFHVTKKFVGVKEGYIGLFFYWLGFEYMHYHWELSWPWLNFGNMFANHHYLVQWYSYSGVLGGTMWILLVNMLFYLIAKNVFFKKESWNIQTPLLVLQAILILFPVISSLIIYYNYEEEGDELNVLIIQPNIDPYQKFSSITPDQQIDKIIHLVEQKMDESVDLIIAPETALPMSINEDGIEKNGFILRISQKLEEWNGPDLLIGSSTHLYFDHKNSYASRNLGNGVWLEAYNSALLISRNKPIQIYHKSQLVLGVERLPFPAIFENMAIDMGGTTGTLGAEEKPFCLKSKGMEITPCICYESVYGGYVAEFSRLGSDFIAIMTNDGWWKDTPGYKQHLNFARLRAIENRKFITRSANTGISAILNSRGDVLEKTGWWEDAVIKGTIRLSDQETFYVKYGDVIGRVSGFTAVLILIFAIFKWLRSFGSVFKKEQNAGVE
ncbi:MAG: apolipoprotein N-acyltransferase [Crocinitomicaceae bacterium]|nr:apolipoprotein N-acyltransferase [Crocinitomicaceae bacterium]